MDVENISVSSVWVSLSTTLGVSRSRLLREEA